MKIDIYTKKVLTVIAVCLLVIVLRDVKLIPSVYATSGNEVVKVQIVGIDKSPFDRWEALPVKIIK